MNDRDFQIFLTLLQKETDKLKIMQMILGYVKNYSLIKILQEFS